MQQADIFWARVGNLDQNERDSLQRHNYDPQSDATLFDISSSLVVFVYMKYTKTTLQHVDNGMQSIIFTNVLKHWLLNIYSGKVQAEKKHYFAPMHLNTSKHFIISIICGQLSG